MVINYKRPAMLLCRVLNIAKIIRRIPEPFAERAH